MRLGVGREQVADVGAGIADLFVDRGAKGLVICGRNADNGRAVAERLTKRGCKTEFVRADLTLSQVQAIRGGSASTFSSNSPGGVINLISKTGEEEGGGQHERGEGVDDGHCRNFGSGAAVGA